MAKARGIAQLAKDTGLGRESLYKTLTPGSKPRFETIMKITKALGVPLSVKTDAGSKEGRHSPALPQIRVFGQNKNHEAENTPKAANSQACQAVSYTLPPLLDTFTARRF